MFLINELMNGYLWLLTGLLKTWSGFWVMKRLINCSWDSTIYIISQKEERGLCFFLNITTNCNLCYIIFESMHFKIWIYFLFSPRDDPRVTALVKHKEFDELMHWHSRRPLSDDYDRTKCQFDGELCDSGEIN